MRKENGYFTVEAAMVFPIAFAVVLFVMYLLFFQYNRCIMEQDTGIIALRGSSVSAENHEERIRMVSHAMAKLDKGKYVAWNDGETKVRLEKGTIRVSGSGEMEVPFVLPGVKTNLWQSEAEFRNYIFSPVTFVRNCRKVLGGNK
jgi:hypothetical protein